MARTRAVGLHGRSTSKSFVVAVHIVLIVFFEQNPSVFAACTFAAMLCGCSIYQSSICARFSSRDYGNFNAYNKGQFAYNSAGLSGADRLDGAVTARHHDSHSKTSSRSRSGHEANAICQRAAHRQPVHALPLPLPLLSPKLPVSVSSCRMASCSMLSRHARAIMRCVDTGVPSAQSTERRQSFVFSKSNISLHQWGRRGLVCK